MNFNNALELLKTGSRLCRRGWNGKGMWIALVRESSAKVVDTVEHQAPYVVMKTTGGSFVPWLASQSDLLAEDWELVTD